MYQALYRKWRPRTFDDVVGQAHITDTLKRQVASGRMSHAYLFTGTRGTGKTTCAKILSRAVNCEHPINGNPCNACPACLGIENGSILDVLELDAASNNGVDQVRALRDEAVYTPAAVRKRVYIVDEVHMLSTAAFNALLKILEEPPAHLMFILATTELHKVPATIKSRCQQFSFKRILPGDISSRLKYVAEQEHMDLTSEGAALLSRLADGGMRDALSLLDQCAGPGGQIGEQQVLDALGLAGNLETAHLMEQIGSGDTAGALETLSRLYSAGKDVGSLLGELSALTRDLLVRKTAPHGGAALLTGGYDENTMRRLSNAFTSQRLVVALSRLQSTIADMARSANRRTDAELCIIRLCDESLDESLVGLSARVAKLESLVAGGIPTQCGVPEKPVPRPAPRAAVPPVRETPPPRPRAVEACPPWEEERPPLPEEPAEMPTLQSEPIPAAAPDRTQAAESPAAPTDSPEHSASPAGVAADLWPGLIAGLRGRVPMGEYTFLNNPAMVQGRFEGDQLILWVDSDFVKNMVGKRSVLDVVEQAAGSMAGHPYRCIVKIGKAPPITAPSDLPSANKDHDNLDDLLAFGQQFDNIIITE